MSPGADRWLICVTTGCVALLALNAGTVPKHRSDMHGLGVPGLALSRLSIAASATSYGVPALVRAHCRKQVSTQDWQVQ